MRFSDICLVCGIVENQRIVLQSVVHPFLEFLLCYHRARRVVGIAEVYHVYAMVGNLRHEVVGLQAWHIGDVAPLAVFEHSRPAAHHVGVDVYRIDRVGHSQTVVPSHQFADVSSVALRSVVYKHLARVETDASRQEVVFHYRLAEPQIALFRSVSMERLLVCHVVYCLVHGVDDGRHKRTRHVADAEADDSGLGISHLVGIHLLGDVGKKVVLLKFQVMFVY